jgi:hypothetical protein
VRPRVEASKDGDSMACSGREWEGYLHIQKAERKQIFFLFLRSIPVLRLYFKYEMTTMLMIPFLPVESRCLRIFISVIEVASHLLKTIHPLCRSLPLCLTVCSSLYLSPSLSSFIPFNPPLHHKHLPFALVREHTYNPPPQALGLWLFELEII